MFYYYKWWIPFSVQYYKEKQYKISFRSKTKQTRIFLQFVLNLFHNSCEISKIKEDTGN